MTSFHLLSSVVHARLIASPVPVVLPVLYALSAFVPGVASFLIGALSSNVCVLPLPTGRRIFFLAGSVYCYQLMSVAPSTMHHEPVPRFALSMKCSRNQQVFDTP